MNMKKETILKESKFD